MLLQLSGTTFDFRLSTFDFRLSTFDFRLSLPLEELVFSPGKHREILKIFRKNPLGSLSLYSIKATRAAALPSLLCLCYDCTPCGVALCGLLCGSVAAFYGVGVLFIGYGVKIALRGKYGRSTGCGVSRLCCACGLYAAVGGSVALYGRFPAVVVFLYG